jgi:hypothetical protein
VTAPQRDTATAGEDNLSGRPARPAGYWERVDRIVAQAPLLDDGQRARLRVIFHQANGQKEKAA